MIKKNKNNTFNVSVVIKELKQLNTHLNKISYLIYQHSCEAWSEDKKVKVLTELKGWNNK